VESRVTEWVRHRVNDPDELAALPGELGAEIDIRSLGGRLVLHHEPHRPGPELAAFLDVYARTRRERLLILNPKEDGLDAEILALVKARGIENFFFLDLTLPSTVRMAVREGERRIAMRVSEYETAEAARRFMGKADWIWLDCFSGEPPAVELARELGQYFRVCLVSPELEGYPAESIKRFKTLLPEVRAVCTKHPEQWR